MYEIWKKKKKIRSFFFVPSETGNFSLKMHAWGGERSVAADVQPVQFPNLRPEANLVILRGQTSGPSKLDGFNRRLIIAWIFHRAIFLLNNIQREIQRSLLSSIRAYATLFKLLIEIAGIVLVVLDETKQNERTKLFAIDVSSRLRLKFSIYVTRDDLNQNFADFLTKICVQWDTNNFFCR